jgi:hypothetical protein
MTLDPMEDACERICNILDTVSEPDQFAIVKRLVMITALKSAGTPEEYLEALADVVADDIEAHLRAKAALGCLEKHGQDAIH